MEKSDIPRYLAPSFAIRNDDKSGVLELARLEKIKLVYVAGK